MARTARDKRPYVKPVKKIELSDKNVKRRIIFVALFLVIGVLCITYGVSKILYTPSGWYQIEVDKNAGKNCGSDFVFYYNLGQNGNSATDERRNLKKLYGNACDLAYKLFTAQEEVEDCNNVYYINHNPNQIIQIEDTLYEAFEKLDKKKCRNIFLGPVLEHYNNLFFCEEEAQTIEYDPYNNQEIATYYKEISDFARDDKAINLELLGDNNIRLSVSDNYLKYAKENAIESYIDFGWLKNAFIADYLADVFIKNGYNYGIISSYDGFSRTFVDNEEVSQVDLDALYDGTVYPAASYQFSGSMSSVTMRNYGVVSKDVSNYYIMSDGSRRNQYIDIADGKSKASMDQLSMLSKDKTCVDIAFEMLPVYISEQFEEQECKSLLEKGIFSIYCKDKVIYYNSNEISIGNLYEKDNTKFTTLFVE